MKYLRPRLLVAGVGSGVGKTTVSTGLMRALARRGLKVQGFKVGPDYIDPSYHRQATSRPSRNLDSYMLDDDTILEGFLKSTSDADISIIEGVMGLFDGVNGVDDTGSSAYIAKLLASPVLLVVDAWSASRSVAATVLGFISFDPRIRIGGVLLNRVAGERHARWCTDAIERATGVRVVGWLPNDPELAMPERHLGLVPYTENSLDVTKAVGKLARSVGTHVNLERLVRIARSAKPITFKDVRKRDKEPSKVRIGVAIDEAFSFYYADALELLSQSGAKLVAFSPMHDPSLPEGINGLYLGGGFPEVFADQLRSNASMRKSVRRFIEDDMPTFAECGGLMYLTKSIVDFNGRPSSMVGVFDADSIMTKRLTLSYTLASVIQDTILSKSGTSIKGHEFHYSNLESVPTDARFAYRMKAGRGIRGNSDGWLAYKTLATYSHTHLCSDPRMATNFVAACEKSKRQ